MHFAIINTLTDLHHILYTLKHAQMQHAHDSHMVSKRPENFKHNMRMLHLPVPVSRSSPSSIAGFTRFHTCRAAAQKAIFAASSISIYIAQNLHSLILYNPLHIRMSIIINHRNGSTNGKVAESHCGII